MLRWLIVFYLGLTLGVGALNFVLQTDSASRMAQVDQRLQATRHATHDANALLVLTHEYTLRGSERSASQWQAAHRALTDAVAQASPIGADEEDAEELRETTASLTALFDGLSRDLPDLAPAAASERRTMLVDQILSETRLVSDLAYRLDNTLFDILQEEARSFRQRDGLLNWLWLISSLYMAWLLLVRVLRPLEQLRAAAQAVQAGDLQARCRYQERDELGQAAASFNAMTDTLALAQQRTTLAVESAAMGVWDYDLRSGTLVWDEQMYALYGLDPAAEGSSYALWKRSVHPDDLGAIELAIRQAAGNQQPLNTQFRIRLPDGRVRYLKTDAHVIRDAAGTALRMVGVNTDITDQVLAAATLQEQAAMLKRVGRLASIGSWRLELGSSGPIWDEQTRRIHEVPPDFVPTLDTAIRFYAPEHRELIAQAVQQAIRTGEGWDLELRLITFTGRSIWVRAMGEVGHVNGQPAFLFGAFQDITERQQAAQALQVAKDAAEAASAAKGAFLANMSHEIRTPLNAVLGVVHLLEGSGLNPDQQQLLAKAQMAGRSLLDIVNDVLDLAKIEAGEMTLHEAPFQPRQLLDELQSVHSPQAQAKGLTLTVQVRDEVPAWLQGDSARVRQILHNLMGNALKFTARGSVQVELAVAEPANGQPRLRWSVRDTGIGIPADVQDMLFQPFIQADASTTRRFGGTGLGLSIVRRLADLMDGRAGLNSAPGQGSEFWVELPMVVADDARQGAAGSGRLEVAVLQERVEARQALSAQVQALGWRVTAIDTGPELLSQMARRIQVGEPLPAVLVLDSAMKGTTGLDVLRGLAGDIGRERLPATVMIATDDLVALAARDHEHLIDHRVQRISGASELFNAVNSAIFRHTGSTDAVVLSTHPDMTLGRWLAGVRVVVVDDSDINLDVARRLLELQGAEVEIFTSAREALQRLQDGVADIDVVLMDVQMPDMDGLEATRRIRSTPGLHDLPVVALTAGALSDERRRALASGMTDFLSKPMDPPELLRKLRLLAERRRRQALPLEPVGHPVPAAQAPSDAGWASVAGIDAELARSRLSGDWPLFVSILRRLLDDNTDLMQPPPADGDASWRQTLVTRLHKLRGGAGMVGAQELMHKAAAAETVLGTPGAAALPALQALARALRALQAAAAPVLAAHAATMAAATRADGAEPLAAAERHELSQLLQTHDLDALGWIAERAANLRATLGPERAGQLQAAAEALDFRRAAALLSADVDPNAQGLQ